MHRINSSDTSTSHLRVETEIRANHMAVVDRGWITAFGAH